jgi:hypothetical protein
MRKMVVMSWCAIQVGLRLVPRRLGFAEGLDKRFESPPNETTKTVKLRREHVLVDLGQVDLQNFRIPSSKETEHVLKESKKPTRVPGR